MIRFVLRSLLAGLLLLAGCVTATAPDRWATLPEAERGVLFGVISAEMSTIHALTRYEIQYRNLATGEVGTLALAPENRRMFPLMGDAGDPELYMAGKTVGRLFEVALPAGDYEFFGMSFSRSSGYVGQWWRSDPAFSLPFTIAAGKVHYVGELRGYPIIGKSLIGFSVPGGGYFVILDREARDAALLWKRRKAQAGAAPLGSVVNIVPDPERAGTPLLRRAPLPPFQTATY